MVPAAAIIAFLLGMGIASAGWALRRQRHRARTARTERQVIEVSELAGGLAHELRNPLSTIVLNLELLSEDLRQAPQIDAEVRRRGLMKIDSIRQQADRLQSLLDDFLRLVGPASLQTAAVDLNDVVRKLVEFFGPQAANSGIRIRAHYHSAPLPCLLDVRLMEQALLNLLINAQEAMPQGGDLLITTAAGEGRARLEVTDTGVGIPPADRDKIFRPFFSTKPGGTGLGLCNTHRAITQHGGAIDVDSTPNVGTRFTVRLPLAV